MTGEIERFDWPMTMVGWKALLMGGRVLSGDVAVGFITDMLGVVKGGGGRVRIRSRSFGLSGDLVIRPSGSGELVLVCGDGTELSGRFLITRRGDNFATSVSVAFCGAFERDLAVAGATAVIPMANSMLPALVDVTTGMPGDVVVLVDQGLSALMVVGDSGLRLKRRRLF